jgi:HEAT repeat protein
MAIFSSVEASAQTLLSSASPSTVPSAANTPGDLLRLLQSTDAPQAARDTAALQLIASRDPALRPGVVQILTDGSVPAEIAMARAIGSVGWADAQFIDPLLSMLRGRETTSAVASTQALRLYADNAQVMQALIDQAKSNRTDVREPAIRALGSFGQKAVADTLIWLLENEDSDPAIREAAGNALIQMTGRTDLDHDSTRWAQWLQKNENLPDNQFHDMIIRGRGEAFEEQVADHRTLQNAADDFLEADFWNAPADQRSRILLSYLQSPAPEIRALGADLVYSSASRTGAPPKGTIEQTRLLLADPSTEVRAAAAKALSWDNDSAPDLVAQLAREPDDLVRVRLIESLAPFQDVHAIQEMLKLVGTGASMSVRIAAAEGIREGIGDPKMADLKKQAIDTLKAALNSGTDAPDQQHLREAIVGALAAIHDDSLADLFRHLLSSHYETPGVRANALVGLGGIPNSAQYAPEIAPYLDDGSFQMRLAAIQAVRNTPAPIPIGYINKLLDMMTEDGNDQVRAAAWAELVGWAQSGDMDEIGLSTLAGLLKAQPENELLIRKILCDRLAQQVQKGAVAAGGHPAAQELAEEQQTVGDLLMNPPISRPDQAANYYRSALDYWKANQGGVNVIDRLCASLTRALLQAKQWDDAAAFASEVVKQYGHDPNLMKTSETVGREFVSAAQNLVDSTDPGAYTDAENLLNAAQKMSPPLPQDFQDQLTSSRTSIEAKHAAASQP